MDRQSWRQEPTRRGSCGKATWEAGLLSACFVAAAAHGVSAQTPRQLSILQAEAGRAHTARELAVLRSGAGSLDADTAVLAVRASAGSSGRPSSPSFCSPFITTAGSACRGRQCRGQAAAGWGSDAPAADLNRALAALIARLGLEDEADVRAAICETLGRLPYTNREQAGRAEAALVHAMDDDESITSRLAVAQGLESLERLQSRERLRIRRPWRS